MRAAGLSAGKQAALKDLAQKTLDGVVPSLRALTQSVLLADPFGDIGVRSIRLTTILRRPAYVVQADTGAQPRVVFADDGSVLREAQEALHRAVNASRVLASFPGVGGGLDWSPDGNRLIFSARDKRNRLYFLDFTKGVGKELMDSFQSNCGN